MCLYSIHVLMLLIASQMCDRCNSVRLINKPNIVILVADDLGIGDLGCFGNDTIKTPNIDRLASEGVRLTHHLAAASLCTPSRAALMTARYPARYGLVEAKYGPPVIVHVASKVRLPLTETTIGHAFTAANYTTVAVGKWHLGSGCELFGRNCRNALDYGFTKFHGLPLTLDRFHAGPHPFFMFPFDDVFYQGLAFSMLTMLATSAILINKKRTRGAILLFIISTILISFVWFIRTHYRFHHKQWWQMSNWMNQYLNGIIMTGDIIEEQPLELNNRFSQRLIDHSIKFLNDHHDDNQPFLLYHSFAHVHTPMFSAPHMAGKSAHGRYGDNVEELDEGVGRILRTLDELNINDKTIVYFLSDHGGHLEAIDADGHRDGGHNGLFKGGKGMGGAEGGIRVPGIMRWSGKLLPEEEVSTPTSLLDVLPTLLDLADLPPLHKLIPTAQEIDGLSFANLLRHPKGIDKNNRRVFLHHCGESIHAIRLLVDGEVYKMHLKQPLWERGSTQCGWGPNILCSCYEPLIKDLTQQPLLYHLNQDPYEDHPLSNSSARYIEVVQELKEYLKHWQQNVTYPSSQFNDFWNTINSIWLQPFKF